MFNIRRTRDINSITDMVPHLTLDAQEVPAFLDALETSIHSENLFILEARREGEIKGFLFAQAQPGVSYVFIAQLWSDKTNPQRVLDEMLTQVILWTAALGRRSLRGETKRDVGAVYRRSGFQELSVNVEFIIPPDFIPKLLAAGREIIHG